MLLSDHTEHIVYAVTGFVTGGGALRFMVYVSNALPPLPKGSGFFSQLFYNIVKNASGVDPNTVAVPAPPAVKPDAAKPDR